MFMQHLRMCTCKAASGLIYLSKKLIYSCLFVLFGAKYTVITRKCLRSGFIRHVGKIKIGRIKNLPVRVPKINVVKER